MSNGLADFAYDTAARDAAWSMLPIINALLDSGEVVGINPLLAETFGYTMEELKGKPVEDLFVEDDRAAHAGWRSQASVRKTRFLGLSLQIRGLHKNGDVFPVHVGMIVTEALGQRMGVELVIDLNGVVNLEPPVVKVEVVQPAITGT